MQSHIPRPTTLPLTSASALEVSKIDGLDLLLRLERAVHSGKIPEATELFSTFIEYLGRNSGSQGVLSPRPSDQEQRAFYTRIAAAITALVNSPSFRLAEPQVAHLSTRKPVLEAIFELSGFGGPDHLLQFHAAKSADGSLQLTGGQVFFLALFYSLDHMPDDLSLGVLQLPPNQLLMLALGWLSVPAVLTRQGEKNRRLLLDAHERLSSATISASGGLVLGLTTTWMQCSYADTPTKHKLKAALNEVWRRLCATEDVRAQSPTRRMVDRPNMLVLAERMQSGHAMHRVYAEGIAQMRQRFRVTCLAHESNYDPETAYLFDEVDVMRGNLDFEAIAGRIIRKKPDFILYPSLGMSEWTQAMCNLRFAPIQAMMLGHPAPALCDTIDYTIVQAGMGSAAHEFGRKVIERQAWGSFMPHADLLTSNVTRTRPFDGSLHVAINSSKMKLSPRFLAVCERMQAEAGRPLHFHFFASVSGIAYDRMFAMLTPRFQRMTLHPPRPYGEFLQSLVNCDLALSAFPFGNTNSTVDTCLLAIPNVAYFANEVLSVCDRDVMRMVGLPAWLVGNSDEEYFQAAMRLVNDDAERQRLRDYLTTTDVRSKFFSPQRPEDKTEFVDAMWWIYQNHEALQVSSAHLLKAGEPIPA